MTKETKETKERYLLFPMDPETMKPNIESIASFPNMEEALKAKAFLRVSGMLVLILPVAMVESKKEFCQLWEERVKSGMIASLEISNIPK